MNLKKFVVPIRTDKVEKCELWFIRTVRRLKSFTTLHAFFVCFVYVPFVLSVTDIDSRLVTYEDIYNNTQYHIQKNKPPYNDSRRPYSFNYTEDTKENEVEGSRGYRFKDGYENSSTKEQLLVGFAHAPFRLSIPEEDYLNGVREIDPKQYSNKGVRGKRGVVHLYNMLLCATGCEPLLYQGYGCYCGLLGSGRPMDAIDECCQLHDECYDNVSCPFYSEYYQPYYWSCSWGYPKCSLKNYKKNVCAARLCECDRKLAMCVQRYRCPRRNRRPLCEDSPLQLLQNLISA